MSPYIPQSTDRYAVVSSNSDGPRASFWSDYKLVIDLLTRYAISGCCTSSGVSVWHRRNAKARWVCLTD